MFSKQSFRWLTIKKYVNFCCCVSSIRRDDRNRNQIFTDCIVWMECVCSSIVSDYAMFYFCFAFFIHIILYVAMHQFHVCGS